MEEVNGRTLKQWAVDLLKQHGILGFILAIFIGVFLGWLPSPMKVTLHNIEVMLPAIERELLKCQQAK